MMIDGRSILLALAILAAIGFVGGVVASIWAGPIAMLWGAIGVPVGVTVLIAVLLAWAALRDWRKRRREDAREAP